MNGQYYAKSKKRQSGPNGRTVAIILLLSVVVVLMFTLFKLVTAKQKSDNKYIQGVYIHDIDMSVFSKEEGEAYFANLVDTLLNTEYTLTYNDKQYTFMPSRDANAQITGVEEALTQAWSFGHTGDKQEQERVKSVVRLNPQCFDYEISYSEKGIVTLVNQMKADIDIPAVDAEIMVTSTEPKMLSESVDGIVLEEADAVDMLIELIKNGSENKVLTLPVTVDAPSVSSASAQGGLTPIAVWETDMTQSSWKRRGNVRLGLNCFNAMEVKDGEMISFNDVVGERTEARGYVEATVYYGATTSSGIGGGICQASSTLYGAILKAGLMPVERYHHAMVVGYTLSSCDAAVDWDSKQDFKFVNNTGAPIYIFTHVDKTVARVTIYGKEPQYRIELEPEIVQDKIANHSVVYKDDVSESYVYFKDETKLYKEGKLGRASNLYRVYYDKETGEQVEKELISNDTYSGEATIYWRGIHDR